MNSIFFIALRRLRAPLILIIAIVAVIRQGRDIPAILQKWSMPIRKELIAIRGKIERGDISLPGRRRPTPRHRKK